MPDDFDSPAPPGDEADFETLSQGIDHIPAPIPVSASERTKKKAPRLRAMTAADWPSLAAALPLTGLAAELARQSEWLGAQGEQVNLRVAVRSMAESPGKSRLRTLL